MLALSTLRTHQNFCLRQPRCVKCAGNHQTLECSRKVTSQNVKCVLCEGNHPANYKGCQIYKELQKTKYPALRKKSLSRDYHPTIQTTPSRQPARPVRSGTTYAQAMKSSGTQPTQSTGHSILQSSNKQIPHRANDIDELKNMMKGLIEQMSTVLNLLTALVAKITHNG